MGKGHTDKTQYLELLNDWGISETDVVYVKYLTYFHDVGTRIYKRNDTGQYFSITSEDSWDNDVDDYFIWCYLTDEEKKKYGLK